MTTVESLHEAVTHLQKTQAEHYDRLKSAEQAIESLQLDRVMLHNQQDGLGNGLTLLMRFVAAHHPDSCSVCASLGIEPLSDETGWR